MADETSTEDSQWNADGGTIVTATSSADDSKATTASEKSGGSAGLASETSSAASSSTTGEVGQAMQGSSDSSATIVVHSDSSIDYGCPQNGSWSHSQVLSGSLTGSTVDGAGCYVSFTFTGDSVTMYGATGPKAGTFGCSTSSEIWEAVGWWSAYGTTPYFAAYQGSCTISGLGFGKHTITMTNSPNDPKLMYFTGLRYTTNQSAVTYAAPSWSACCAAYTFPDGAVTTIKASSAGSTSTSAGSSASGASSSSSASSSSVDYDWKTVLSIALVALGIVALASLLVGAMCCKKRSKPSDDLLTEMASGKDLEKEPLRKKKKRSSRRRDPSSDEESTTESSGSSDDDSKKRR